MSSDAPARQWFVYIVRCHDGTLYTGSSPDVDRRLLAHNAGSGAKYTRARRPVQLTYCEQCPDRSSALKREQAIKRLARTQKLTLISSSKT